MFDRLQKIASVELRGIWRELDAVKQDVKANLNLGIYNLLIKDFKIFPFGTTGNVPCGVASLVVPVDMLLDHFSPEAVAQSMLKLMSERKLAYFIIVTTYNKDDGSMAKDVLLFDD